MDVAGRSAGAREGAALKGLMTVLHVKRPLLCGVILAALFPTWFLPRV